MNTGRALWEARWLRVVVVFSLTATMAAVVVPSVVRQAAEREDARGLLVRVEDPDSMPLITLVAAATQADVYWVQVGVYRDSDAAKRVAQRLRERKYRVEESVVQRQSTPGETGGPSAVTLPESRARYEVVVAGGVASELTAKVAALGLAGRPSPDGVVITPSLPLSEAVALSKDLTGDGITVRVRRVGSPAGPATQEAELPAVATGGAATLHRVRVGGFADRSTAMAALRELEALGYKPFLARGSE
jgi:hypothetical protein